METKFKSQVCTDRSQSERLVALSLKKETADMRYYALYISTVDKWYNKEYPEVLYDGERINNHDIPAWSLGRLWELYWSNKVVSDCLFECGKYMNPYAEMIAMIEYDIEDGTFNKDYLDKQWE